jgi:hypothetical protein
MAHCNPSTWKAEAGESRVGLHSETVFQKQTNKQTNKIKRVKKKEGYSWMNFIFISASILISKSLK